MCGIFGAYSKDSIQSLEKEKLIESLDTLSHRGPDSSGHWLSSDSKLFLGHRRLAIIDLSPAGHQPMHSQRYSISFNGEIYNFLELKKELEQEGVTLGSLGDTAVMLASFETWGIEKSINKFVGMFAFAVWDKHKQELTLARDRAGEKPLYYAWRNNLFIFASDLAAIVKASKTRFKINSSALGYQLQFGYIPSPLSIYSGVFKLPAACFLKLSSIQLESCPDNYQGYICQDDFGPKQYWKVGDSLELYKGGTESEYLIEIERLLKRSISQQMMADVPLGAFLSGGIDSTTVVAIMQSVSTRPVKTYSIGFSNKSYDEAPFAKAIAAHLGTEHTEMYVSEQDALDVIPFLPEVYTEPFGDSSQVPTYLVSKLTRKNVTVSLSGDGGDEIFGGYQRYIWTKKVWEMMSWTPGFAKNTISGIAQLLPTKVIDNLASAANNFLPQSLQLKNAAAKIQRALSIGATPSAEDLFLVFLSQKILASNAVRGFVPAEIYLASTKKWPKTNSIYNKLMWMDFVSYLPDDILVKVDRAAMAVALESRAPFLDHRLVEFAFALPIEMKINGNSTKYILRKLLEKYVPNTLTHRPKMGFGIPVADWISGKLRLWAEELLSKSALEESGCLYPQPILNIWNAHLKGNHSNQYFLWHVLMFQSWFRKYKPFIES